jgi:hypothetical protein
LEEIDEIIEIGKDLQNFREISFLMMCKGSVYSGTLNAIKKWLSELIENNTQLIEKFGADVNQFIKISEIVKEMTLKPFQGKDGILLERANETDDTNKIGILFFVFQVQLENINKMHPHIKPIEEVISQIKNEIFIHDIKSSQSYLKDKLEKIEKNLQNFKIQEVSLDIIGFRALLFDLRILRKSNWPQTNKLLKKLLKCPNSQYYGTRYEILISRVLVDSGVDFTMPDPPDFLIVEDNFEFSIECTSKHFTVEKTKEDLIKGIFSTIDKKNDPKFNFNQNTVLAIDITNVGYNSEDFFSNDYEKNKTLIKKKIDQTRFGGILLSSWILDEKNSAYINLYTRIDSENITEELKLFLNSKWPNDKTITTSPHFRIPKTG